VPDNVKQHEIKENNEIIKFDLKPALKPYSWQ
jgi:hypothetical protein